MHCRGTNGNVDTQKTLANIIFKLSLCMICPTLYVAITKTKTNDVSKASNHAFRSKGPDDENFYVSLPVKFHGDEEFQKVENQGILK